MSRVERLRPLRWWDIEQLVALERVLFVHDPWTAESFWAELGAGPDRWYVVAEDAVGEIVGYAGLTAAAAARGGDAEVMTVAVAPGAQGGGIGRALITALRDEAARRGAGRLILEVRADNPSALSLYAATGFEQVGIRKDYYQARSGAVGAPATARSTRAVGGAVDAVVMRLGLSGAGDGPDSLPG